MTDDTGLIPAEAASTELGDDGLLMRLYDGELEAKDLARAEAMQEAAPDAKDKLASMALVGEMLRDHVEADARADGIAAAVMAQIEAGADMSLDDGIEDAAPTEALPNMRRRSKSAANDNARVIFAAAGLAAAVAVGMFFWGGQESIGPIVEAPAPLAPTAGVEASLEDSSPAAKDGRPHAEIEEYEPTVEVASVDFGSKSGSVFYVPSGEPGAATTVVWVSDLEEEEEL